MLKLARWVLVSLLLSTANSAQPASAQKAAISAEFVRIQPGEFMMGCVAGDKECMPVDEALHRVRITKEFELGKYEVTQAQWQSVMGSNPSSFKGANRPVEKVSWNDAQEFLEKLNSRHDGYRYRLPTEAEWEYAAAAGAPSVTVSFDLTGWYDKNSGRQTHPVGQKQPNAWGLYDMSGNVWEWVQDWYGESYYRTSPPDDPSGPATGRTHVIKGGSWSEVASSARPSGKFYLQPTVRLDDLGFRFVRGKAL
jgi:formylglycine-generating enzyme required for sulfatase activity